MRQITFFKNRKEYMKNCSRNNEFVFNFFVSFFRKKRKYKGENVKSEYNI